MKAYVRKLDRLSNRISVVIGPPDNHANNTIVDQYFITRRQAIRYIKKHGYELVIKKKAS